jgi:hypothetical protein
MTPKTFCDKVENPFQILLFSRTFEAIPKSFAQFCRPLKKMFFVKTPRFE